MIINRYAKGGGLSPRILVTAATGSTVTCTKGGTTLTATEVSGKWTFNLNDFGTWTVNATLGGKSATKDVDVVWAQVYEVTLLFVDATLNNNDWETIKQVADASAGESYWAVGDTKQITMNGKVSDGLTLSSYSTYVYIIGFNHNSSVEGTGIAFGGFKTAASGGVDVVLCDSGYNRSKGSGQWFNMNNTQSNYGGWESSRMRSTTLPLVKSALPSDLQAVLKTTTIYSDNTGGGSDTASYVTATQDELYLLAEFEIFGTRSYANSAERNHQQQYAYYVAGNSKIKYRHNSTATAVYWWERSVFATNNSIFCRVGTNGTAGYDTNVYSFGLAVAFKVGSPPPPKPISNLAVGDIVKVKESDTDVDYIIIQQGNPDTTMYDASCDGTWLLRKTIKQNTAWNTTSSNDYATSTINSSTLNTDILNSLNIKDIVSTVKIPLYTNGSVQTGSSGYETKVFLLSSEEVGCTNVGSVPHEGAILSYFSGTNSSGRDNKRIFLLNSSANMWWTRTPVTSGTSAACLISTIGAPTTDGYSVRESQGILPAFIVPSDTLVSTDGTIQV